MHSGQRSDSFRVGHCHVSRRITTQDFSIWLDKRTSKLKLPKFLALGVFEIMAILDWYQVTTVPNLILEITQSMIMHLDRDLDNDNERDRDQDLAGDLEYERETDLEGDLEALLKSLSALSALYRLRCFFDLWL